MIEKVKLNSFNHIIEFLSNVDGQKALAENNRGIERETLRITPNAKLATNPHPKALGSSLTHSRITTDYSESLLEFITPVSTNINELLTGLTETHAYTVKHLDGQQLWPVSMPCYVIDEASIPVAQFGTSNVGKMKTLYRTGLTHRYGALMQIISGVHFNFSVSNDLWDLLYNQSGDSISKQDFISESYFGLIRNYRRLMWVLPYLFGASPTVCASFIEHSIDDLNVKKLDNDTYYLPWATSLRMSDLGYTNKEQEKLNISYNSLDEYLFDIKKAIQLPSDKFEKIGVKVDGHYRQLNRNILQIENEFYAPIRAKRVTEKGEKPSEALERRGVEYIEVRALDVNPFSPIGINESQVRFLDLFLLYCLLSPSSKSTTTEEAEIANNFRLAILEGRKPDLSLTKEGKQVSLSHWLESIFKDLKPIAILLDSNAKDSVHNSQTYQDALNEWQVCIQNPEKTLSGQVMANIMANNNSQWALSLSKEYTNYFNDYYLSADTVNRFKKEATDSFEAQKAIELADKIDFDQYLQAYFSK